MFKINKCNYVYYIIYIRDSRRMALEGKFCTIKRWKFSNILMKRNLNCYLLFKNYFNCLANGRNDSIPNYKVALCHFNFFVI